MATPLTQTTGRRKEAIARARLRPGTGTITVNGRPFDAYFTTPAHRMEASEPLRTAEATERYDVDATITGGGVSGQAGALRMALARSLAELEPESRAHAEEGRPPHPRLAEEGEQEVRPQEGPQGAAVHQALTRARPRPRLAVMKFGTDGVRGVANSDLTASFALDLGRAAARVLGGVRGRRRRRHPRVDGRCSRPRSSPAWPARASSSHRLGVVPTPVVAFESARRGVPRRRHLGVAQPVPGQRHQAVRPRRVEAAATTSRQRIEADVVALPAADAATRPRCSTPRPARRYVEHVLGRARGPPASTGCGSSSTAANGAASALAAPLLRATGADVVVDPRPARRPQHQRRLRRDAHRRRSPRPSSRTAPTSAWPSTATPTGCSPSTTPAPSSTATTSSPSAPSTATPAACCATTPSS